MARPASGNRTPRKPATAVPAPALPAQPGQKTAFRFYDNRQNYLSFINTCNEKYAIAKRAGREVHFLHPTAPALRVHDAGMGDATVLADGNYLKATARILQKYGGLHINDETFVISRNRN